MCLKLLVDGKIPANTVCPWKQQCNTAQDGRCHHQGKEHPGPFSCGKARAFELLARAPDE